MGRDNNHPDNSSERQEVLQAILLADSFSNTFRPITLCKDTPRVLCPLNNITLLDYSIDWLAGSGVEELILFCASGHDAIVKHIARRNKQQQEGMMKIECIHDPNCGNAGDALRELDRRGLIRSDPFLLLHGGDVVTNVDIAPAMALHKARKKKDPSAMMTVLLKPVDTNSSTVSSSYAATSIRSALDDLVVGLDTSINDPQRILLFQSRPRRHSVSLPCSFFTAHSNITLRTDLLDTGIDICSPDVLARFSDEFDYRHVRKQFLSNSAAEEEEGLQNRIYAHILDSSEYAARVQDLRTYHAVSRDLLRRWCYPVVPDNLPSGYESTYRYAFHRHHVYKEVKASTKGLRRRKSGKSNANMSTIARKSTIGACTMLGAHVRIGEGCEVKGTVIGHSCIIHHHSKITSSHLWNNVEVHPNAKISHSILCDNVIVRQDAVIGKGCVIGKNCIIGKGVVLPDYTRITLEEEKDNDDGFGDNEDAFGSFDEEDEESDDGTCTDDSDTFSTEEKKLDNNDTPNDTIVGPDGVGRVWHPPSVTFTEDDPDADSDYENLDSDSDHDDDNNTMMTNVNEFDVATPTQRMHSQSVGYDTSPLYQHRHSTQQKEGQLEDEDDYHSENDDVENDDHDDTTNTTDVMSTTYGVTTATNSLMITGRSRGVDVVKELKAICMEHDTVSPIENLMIELNGFKFSQNATFGDCVSGAILAILDRIQVKKDVTKLSTLKAGLQTQLSHWKPLFDKMCHSIEEEKSIVMALETAATSPGDLGNVLSTAPSFRVLLQTLYDLDVASEEAILEWAKERREDFEEEEDGKNPEEEKKKKLFYQETTQSFLEWLEEESESEGESGGDDSDRDSD